MIQGPPGTGKTHLLGWILIALILEAHGAGKPLRIGISALTHQAIDTVLQKVVSLVNTHLPGGFPGQCVKWGQPASAGAAGGDSKNSQRCKEDFRKREDSGRMALEFTSDARDLPRRPWLILGATGYGFYNLFESKTNGFPRALDWVVFDEASQVPLPQALLGLMYGRGRFLFLGDVNQLPPIVLGDYSSSREDKKAFGHRAETPCGILTVPGDGQGDPVFHGEENGNRTERCDNFVLPGLDHSILQHVLQCYPSSHQITLDTTYRMNREICSFPARTWYQNALAPASDIAWAKL
jgi:hypothetical protein